jgi:hypothetical protein
MKQPRVHPKTNDNYFTTNNKTNHMSLKQFTIFGERCSGTCWVTKLVETNFSKSAHHPFGWKHFTLPKNPNAHPDTLVIVVVRNPIDWIRSFYRTPHHIPPENRKDLHAFLSNTLVSQRGGGGNADIKPDGTLWNNVLQMRKEKHAFWMDFMAVVRNRKGPGRCLWVSYEAVLKNPEAFLEHTREQTGWEQTTDKWNLLQDNHYVGNKVNTNKRPTPVCYMQPKEQTDILLKETVPVWTPDIVGHVLNNLDETFENGMSGVGSSFLPTDEQDRHMGTWAVGLLKGLYVSI